MKDKEYIERELAIKKLKEYALEVYNINLDNSEEFAGDSVEENYCEGLCEAIGAICSTPTADVVEVTYCRDCTHCDPENKHCDHPMGTSLPVPRKDTDFCSYGKRKED